MGLKLVGKGVARQGMKIFNDQEKEIGIVTSGTFSSISGSVAMGYVKKSSSKVGSKIYVDIRGKMVEAVIHKPPFVEPGYYRIP